MPAATAAGGVRVVDDEAAALEAVLEVDLGAFEVHRAAGVDVDLVAVLLDDVVVLAPVVVEGQTVAEAGAAAAADEEPQRIADLALALHEALDLLRRRGRDRDHLGRGRQCLESQLLHRVLPHIQAIAPPGSNQNPSTRPGDLSTNDDKKSGRPGCPSDAIRAN